MPRCHPDNPCSGKYGNCLDVKLTNQCNGACNWCIERGGYRPSGRDLGALELAAKINAHPAHTVLLLGGEPTLYHDLGILLEAINPQKKIYLTTNGSRLTRSYVRENKLHLLTGMSISIHHFQETKNRSILRLRQTISWNILKEALEALDGDTTVRINCNLIRSYIDDLDQVKSMILLARYLGADSLRLAEVQGRPTDPEEEGCLREDWVNASAIWPDLPDEPFTEGCEHTMEVDGFPVTVRQACGWVCLSRREPRTTNGHNPQTHVLYTNGQITNGWVRETVSDEPDPECHGGSTSGCGHRSRGRREPVVACHRVDDCH